MKTGLSHRRMLGQIFWRCGITQLAFLFHLWGRSCCDVYECDRERAKKLRNFSEVLGPPLSFSDLGSVDLNIVCALTFHIPNSKVTALAIDYRI